MSFRLPAAIAACLALAACANSQNVDKSAEYGADPQLPEPSRALLPRMHVPDVIGWQQGETPTVPQGFRIEAVASGLSNPRNVYALPTGDLLVVESKKDAKEPIERPKRTQPLTPKAQASLGIKIGQAGLTAAELNRMAAEESDDDDDVAEPTQRGGADEDVSADVVPGEFSWHQA